MKHNRFLILLLVICFLLLLGLTSCNDTKRFDDHRYVEIEAYYDIPENARTKRAGLYEDEALMTEVASQIVMCKITELDEVQYTAHNGLWFAYTAEVQEIYLDSSASLAVGDTIHLKSDSGMVSINDLLLYHIRYQDADLLGIDLRASYSDRAYLAASWGESIPIEVGQTYIVYLSDEAVYQKVGYYYEMGDSYLYECDGNTVWYGRDMKRHALTTEELIEQIKKRVSTRSGRCDEIGYIAYLDELMQQQESESETQSNFP